MNRASVGDQSASGLVFLCGRSNPLAQLGGSKESALIFLCPCYAVENGACKSAKITDLVDLQVGCGFLECDGHDWEVSVGTLWPVLLQDAQGSQQVLGAPADQCERLAGHWQTWEVLAGVSIELQGGLMVIWL